QHEADILVGTQMIAKGLDIPLVTLVGVVNADINLHLPDFRSAERTFQLLTQVAGRAGRGLHSGVVVIQTYNPEHYAIRSASKQDYESFFEQESGFRRTHEYPPFTSLIKLGYSNYSEERTQAEAERLYAALEKERRYLGLSGVRMMGPAPSFFRKARGLYRFQINLLGEEARTLLDRVNIPRGWVVDVDPQSML
ncbi:MAG: primosomal protein N', partial [Dehalococcoidia bacterium]|nr:primosomal protein N' [Dehalococcoidia bacterium]